MASQDWLEKDFYKTLGVDPEVSEKELTKKYHKLAHKYHPDSNPGDAAAEAKFKEISEAYSVLSDKEQRTEYDQIRAMGAGGARFSAGGGGFEDMFGGFGGRNVRFTTGGGGFEDIFSMFSGGSAPGGFGGFSGPVAGRDVSVTTTVDFRTAVLGDTVSITGPTGPLKVRIPAGISDGKRIKLRGKGEPSPHGGPAGDLLLTVKVRPHPVFELDGNNIRVKLPVSFTEAVFGATVEVPTLEGKPVKLKLAPHTPSGRLLRVKGRGVTSQRGTGDLLAEVQIAVPSRLTAAQQEALRAFQETESEENPRADMLARAQA